MVTVCEICGNEREDAAARCPFCGEEQLPGAPEVRIFQQKTVNLEAGRPTVEIALRRLTETIEDARRNKIAILTIIHGYGSSGKGGIIREECRKILDYLKNRGTIREYIAGEFYHKRNSQVRALLQRFPRLRFDTNLNRNNKGITLVVILSIGMVYWVLPFITFCATLWS
jgi:hypothetical protein